MNAPIAPDDDSDSPTKSNSNHKHVGSFVYSNSFLDEFRIVFMQFLVIAFQNVANVVPQIVSNMFVGHLPNADMLLAGVGIARTFVNVTGVSIPWGMNSALYTLVPQAIGAKKYENMRLYIQRAIGVNFILFIPLTILQFYGSDIMIALGQPKELENIIQLYCIYCLPYIYLNSINTAMRRLAQAVDLNSQLFYISIACCIIAWPMNTLFVYFFNLGYIGTAVATNFIAFIQLACIIILVYFKGYGYVLVPCRLSQIFNFKGIKSYLYLSIPGLFQYSLEWWIMEIATIISGYIANPQLSVGATVVTSQINLFAIMIASSLGSSISYRMGKYIGAFEISFAKRSLKAGILTCIIISLIMGIICLIFDRELPQLWTYDENVIDLSRYLMHILVIMQITINTYQYLGGIYRGMGYQSIAAIIVIITYYCIALPLCLCLLFLPTKYNFYIIKFNWKDNTNIGTMIIWASLALGNGLAALFLIIYLIFKVNWNRACHISKNRMINDESPLITMESDECDNINNRIGNSYRINSNSSSNETRNETSAHFHYGTLTVNHYINGEKMDGTPRMMNNINNNNKNNNNNDNNDKLGCCCCINCINMFVCCGASRKNQRKSMILSSRSSTTRSASPYTINLDNLTKHTNINKNKHNNYNNNVTNNNTIAWMTKLKLNSKMNNNNNNNNYQKYAKMSVEIPDIERDSNSNNSCTRAQSNTEDSDEMLKTVVL